MGKWLRNHRTGEVFLDTLHCRAGKTMQARDSANISLTKSAKKSQSNGYIDLADGTQIY